MPKIFTPEEIKGYIKEGRTHAFHKDSVKESMKMAVHADGIMPKELIECRRPNEPLEVKEYREKIWIPKTKPPFTKVYNSLQKIRRSSDWNISWPKEEFPRIAEGEELRQYTEFDFPFFSSVTNWVFQVVLRQYLIDANGGVLILPLGPVEDNEYVKPFPFIVRSCDIIDYFQDEYIVIKRPDITYKRKKETVVGKSLRFVTTDRVVDVDQTSEDGFYTVVNDYTHGLGELPFVFWKGAMISYTAGCILYESRIAGMVPELDEAAREYSDLQAAKVLHMYPERWEFTQNECKSCSGTGQRRNPRWVEGMPPDECNVQCRDCINGYVVAGPYSKILVRPPQGLEAAAAGANQIPSPPAGYIEKDVAIIELQEKSIEAHIYNALAAINFEFLSQSPMAQSGVAKAQDRDEAGNTANSIAEDIVAFMDSNYTLFAKYRYSKVYPNDIDKMLPSIAVPERFDLITSSDIAEGLKLAKDSKANPQIINAIELEFAQKRFSSEPEIKDMLELTLTLDPLAGISDDEKMTRLSNKGITQLTYVISSNIQEFVQDAIEADKDFADKDLTDQKKVMATMAQAVIDSQSTAKQIIDGISEDTVDDQSVDQQIPADDSGQPAPNPGGAPTQSEAA